jgi:gamma-glutamyltranspeptidase
MLVRSAKGDYEFVDFRETAPAAAFEDGTRDLVLRPALHWYSC